jgi:hypothetical protein
MAVTSNSLANQALQFVGDNIPPVTGQNPSFGGNLAAAAALNALYGPCVQTVGRQFFWDMARNTITLSASGNTPPYFAYEYIYPTNGIEILQLIPPTLADVNNPLPIDWNVCNALVSSVQTKVIQTNLASAAAVINNNPGEALWDPLFREAVVRLLASELAMALLSKPETSQTMLESGSAFESIGERRPD